METGKVEYAPDYKSKSQVKRIEAPQGKCSMCGENHAEATARDNAARAIAADRARLEREVIEAAKEERKASLEYDERVVLKNWRSFVHARLRRELAVDILIKFESSQQQIKK